MATNHPSLKAAAARSLAARLNAEGARRIADPQVQFAGTVYSPKGMEAYQQGNLLYGVEQPLPLLGKEQAGRTVALRGADLEEVRADIRFQDLQRDLTIALFEAALARRAVELAEADQTWMTDLIRNLEAQLASGTVSPVAVLRAQTELARRRFEVESLRSHEAEALAGVNRRLGQDPDAPLPGFDLPPPAPALAEAVEGNPPLAAA
jgi:outer membrane protein TolC